MNFGLLLGLRVRIEIDYLGTTQKQSRATGKGSRNSTILAYSVTNLKADSAWFPKVNVRNIDPF